MEQNMEHEICMYIYIYSHIHTHTYIYIYIYVLWEIHRNIPSNMEATICRGHIRALPPTIENEMANQIET